MEKAKKGAEIGFCVLLAGLAVVFMLKAVDAAASEIGTQVASAVPCAVIQGLGGEVDLLDSTRTHLLQVAQGAPVPCGGWLSVGKGRLQLKHRDGFTINAGAGTFVQLPEPNSDGQGGGDHVILFRGEVFAQAGGGSGELRVITANSRTRVRRGSAVVVYNQEDEETQLVALDSRSSLENRFETSRKVIAQPGEATSLNFRQLRVVPDAPRAVALAALKPKFESLHVPERDRQIAIKSAQTRQERIFASELVTGEESAKGTPDVSRSVASADPHAKPHETPVRSEEVGADVRAHLKTQARARSSALANSPDRYKSHPEDEETRQLHAGLVSRLGGGHKNAQSMVKPEVRRGPASLRGKAAVASGVRPPAKARKLTPEDEEKLKLIEELSRMRED